MFVCIRHPATSAVFQVRQTEPGRKVRIDPLVCSLDVGYNMYKKNYVAPTTSEGLAEVVHIDFVPKFDSAVEEKIFHYYTES